MNTYFTTFILTVLFLASTFTASFAQPGFGQVWQKYEGNPVFNILEGLGSSWNREATHFSMNVGHAMWDGSEYKFYLGGYDGDNYSIGLAISASLDTGWTWYSENPILPPGDPGSWDARDVGSPVVIKDGDTYKMWYLGSADINYNMNIGYATSTDGTTWEKYAGNPVLEYVPGTWENSSLSSMYVIKDSDSLKMWYADEGLGLSGIGYAASIDGINWVKSNENPVLKPGTSGSWDDGVTVPSVLLENGKYRMWYMGTPEAENEYPWSTGFAISDDGINWTKDPANPVLTVGVAGQWDEDWAVSYDIFKINDSTYNMLYLGSDLEEYHLGLATWDLTTAVESNFFNFPTSFALYQNYPNPFNPSTKIQYSLPKPEKVKIEVYNTLGQRVGILLDQHMKAGHHEIEFNAESLSSGIYFYRIKAGEYQDVKKMVLLR